MNCECKTVWSYDEILEGKPPDMVGKACHSLICNFSDGELSSLIKQTTSPCYTFHALFGPPPVGFFKINSGHVAHMFCTLVSGTVALSPRNPLNERAVSVLNALCAGPGMPQCRSVNQGSKHIFSSENKPFYFVPLNVPRPAIHTRNTVCGT